MIEEIRKLKEAFRNAKTDEERSIIDKRIKEMSNEDNDQFSIAMIEAAKESSMRANELLMKQKMKEVIPAISLVYIAKEYFNKTDTWLYQKMNGNIVNGKPSKFTENEIVTMRFALDDLSNKLKSLSVSI